MFGRDLRRMPRISYFEPEEPDLDEYVFCEKCGDFVFEYCSIHGSLLVIPDDKVPTKPDVPWYVPRAALTIPNVFLHISHSIIPDAGLGVFTTLTLPSGVRFGPYRGEKTYVANSTYCWQIYDKNRKPAHYIDAGDGNKSNWMRYVNCARHWQEQNLVAFQYQGQLYYRTIKIIPRFTELMVFYGSEFACELDVDLGKYNSPTGYAQKFGAPLAEKRKPNDENTMSKQHLSNARLTDEATTIQDPTVIGSSRQDKINEAEKAQITDTNKNPQQILPSKAEITTEAMNGQSGLKSKAKSKSTKGNKAVTKSNKGTKKNIKKNTPAKDNKFTKPKITIQTWLVTNAKSNEIPDAINSKTPKILQGNETDKNERIHMIDTKESSRKNVNPLDAYYYCNDCNKKFISKKIMQRHLILHDPDRAFVCEICKRRFTRLSVLNSHINDVHTKQKPYACTICDKRFTRSSDLKIHMRSHTGEKPYACEICDKRFTQSTNLKRHMRSHTGEKPYACEICDKRFTDSSDFKTHMRSHTGEKPYACEICDKRFTQSIHLKTHMRSHTGEKPYACEICDKRLTRSSYLKTHMRSHTGEKPYACEICDERFVYTGDVKKHLMKKHLGIK